jgi:hypothetical protein
MKLENQILRICENSPLFTIECKYGFEYSGRNETWGTEYLLTLPRIKHYTKFANGWALSGSILPMAFTADTIERVIYLAEQFLSEVQKPEKI